MTPKSCQSAWESMQAACKHGPVHNYVQRLDMADYCVETPLFPAPVLRAYSAWNLGRPIDDIDQSLFNAERGGGQGDYRKGMPEKIANVVDCLSRFPQSKRAVITISNNPSAHHGSDDDAKCLREIHFYLNDNRLSATVLFRAQAVSIFPKNIHFIGTLMDEVAQSLPNQPGLGDVFYLATVLVSERDQ